MQYFDVELFFGFPVSGEYARLLENIDPRVYVLYVGAGDTCLQNIEYQDVRYLGKALGPIAELATLELLQLNIYSLLKRLVPDFSYETTPLQIVPLMRMTDTANV